MKLFFCGFDSWKRPVYKDEKSKLWKDVEPRVDRSPQICSAYDNKFEGEPDVSLKEEDVTFWPCRMVWNSREYTKNLLITQLFSFIKDRRPIGEYADNELEWEQIRSMFITICIICDIEADTVECDDLLLFISVVMEIEGFDEFCDYMLEYIV